MINNESAKQIISSSINNRGAYSTFAEILAVYSKSCKISYINKDNNRVVKDSVEVKPIYLGTTLWMPLVNDIVIIEELDSHITITQPLSLNKIGKKKLSSQPTLTNTIGGVLF